MWINWRACGNPFFVLWKNITEVMKETMDIHVLWMEINNLKPKKCEKNITGSRLFGVK